MRTEPLSATGSKKLLSGKTILITRAASQAGEFGLLLEEQGASVVYFPSIAIAEPHSWADCDRALGNLDLYDGIIFTSANGVRHFLERIQHLRPESVSSLRKTNIYAVGTETRRTLEELEIPVAATPDQFNAEELIHILPAEKLSGLRFLHVRGNLGGDKIRSAVESRGGAIDEVVVYRTVKPPAQDKERIERMLRDGAVNLVTFFSPSSVQNFFEVVSRESVQGVRFAVVGPVTARALEEIGFRPEISPTRSTAASLAESIEQYYSSR